MSKMSGNDKRNNVNRATEKKCNADSLTRFRRPDKNSEETNNSINGIDRREYRQSVATARTKQRNNLEPQHGVTPCRIDSALQNGLSALGYVPQWALPTDCVHWEYQQEPLIAYNESANDDWNLYCNDTSNAPKEIDGNLLLRGVSDLYRHIQTAYQSALTIPKLSLVDQSKESLVLPAEYIGTNPLLSPDYPKGLSLADCPWWERHCPTALIPLANCESIVNEDPTTRKEEHEDRKSNTNDLPYDFSIAKSSSSNRETDPKLLTLHTGRTGEKVSRPKLNSCWTLGKLGETKKLDVEEGLVKDERNTETRSYLSAGHFPSSYWEESEMSGQYPGHSRPPVGTPPPQTVWNHLTMAQSQGKGGANVRVGMSGSNGGGGGGGGGGVGNNNGGGGGGGGGGGSGGGGGGSSGSSGNGNGAGGVGVGGGPTVHESLSRSAYERVQPDLTYLLSEVSGLNMHPTGLSGASLNPAGFYSHPSMTRAAASHLTSQLTPQLAHTQAPPTWHTPTVPSKNVTAPNAPGNPLYSLQMLVDNRQNQSQYRNSPGLQSTLDLSATSEMAENYSRMTQDIPISLTARNVDKGSRNGNIISPPIPLNGETSSDSGISSSVPTPNSVGEAVSLSTKEALTTPKITVKNFESNLKGVANLHDKMKEISVENFAQKVINLPPSVTIERVVASEKKESEQPVKMKDSLSVIAQVPRNVLPVIVNLTSRMDNKDAADSPMRESSSERERKIDESVRSPKNLGKRGKKGVDSLLEKLEGGNKKLGNSENIGSVIVAPPLEEKDSSSVKSMSPERQKSKSPTREDDVVSPAFSNDDSNDNTKQRRKRKLEKPVRLSKDSKTELEDMELEPTEPREPRTCCEPVSEQPPSKSSPNPPSSAAAAAAAAPTVPTVPTVNLQTRSEVRSTEEDDDDHREKIKSRVEEKQVATAAAATTALTTGAAVMTVEGSEGGKIEENERIKRRRSSEGPSTNQTPTNQRTRRRSSDDATEFSKVTSPKGSSSSSNNNNANPFNEVESELEKMFAGIVEEEVDSKDVSKSESMGDLKKKKKKKKEEEEEEEEEADEEEEENPLKREKEGGGPEGKASSKALNLNLTDVTSTVETATKQPAKKAGKKGKVRGGKRKMSRNSDNAFVATIEDVAATKDNKKRRGSKGSKKLVPETPSKRTRKNFKSDGLREMAYDSGSNASSIRSRGPVVHVEGPRDSPLSVQVVNAPREEEEEKSKEKRKSVGNGNAARSKRLGHQNDLDYRGKVSRAGLFSSTLSSRYDAHTTDSTWVCVFCKQGPHSVVPGDPARPHPNLAGPHIAPGTYTVPAGVLSDLFGPYLIGKERLEEGILSADEQEITTEQKKGGKNKRSLRYAGLADQFSAKMGKKKRNSVESLVTGALTGMTMLPGEEQRWEVWLHEQCALWAAGVYMAGGRVTGLQEAVWDSTKSICGSCGLTGANIGCVKRGCKAVTHYPCALTKGWLLDTSQYIPKCNLHRVT